MERQSHLGNIYASVKALETAKKLPMLVRTINVDNIYDVLTNCYNKSFQMQTNNAIANIIYPEHSRKINAWLQLGIRL